jgi:hypothetical protein
MKARWCVGLVLGLACIGRIQADPPDAAPRHFSLRWWTCPCIGHCPDDYVRKPFPAICPISPCGTTDDYCRKPFPCNLAIPHCGGPDDYCRKPLPCLLCPPLSPYLQCGPPDDGCPGRGKHR